MATEIIEGNLAAKPYYTGVGVLSPIDSRLKIYILEGDEITLDTFKAIKNPYPHLIVNVFKKIYENNVLKTELLLGTFEIDDLELKLLGGKVIGASPKSFHQVYSSDSGLYSDYDGSNKHKNSIYFCTDTEGSHVGEIYLNNKIYGNSTGELGKYIPVSEEIYDDYFNDIS